MDNEQAKVVLSAYRPNGADALDPIFAEALAQARQDPALGRWLEEQRRFDEGLISALRTIEPPAALRASLLAGAPAARPRSVVVPFRRWVLPLAAAAVLVFATLATLGPWGASRQADFQNAALTMVDRKPAPYLDLETRRFAETQAFISQRNGPTAPDLPDPLRTVPTAGCRVTGWRGHNVSLTCFKLSNGDYLHLVVISRAALGSGALPTGVHEVNGWRTAYTERDGMVMLWMSRTPMDDFKRMTQT